MVSWCRQTLLHFPCYLVPPLSPSISQFAVARFPADLKLWFRNTRLKHSRQCECVSKGSGAEYPYLEGHTAKVTAASMDGPPPGYRPNAGLCLINSKNQVFVASRLDVPGAWQMPQGGVDDLEDPRAAALRELREETGVISAEIIAEVPHWLTYDFPPDVKEKISHLWGGERKGQAQKWFLLKFTGDEKEINLAGDGTEAAEFSEWAWMPPEQVVEQAVDFKRPVYEQVFRFFAPYLQSESAVL